MLSKKQKLLESLERHKELIFSCIDTWVIDFSHMSHTKHLHDFGSGPAGVVIYRSHKRTGFLKWERTWNCRITGVPYDGWDSHRYFYECYFMKGSDGYNRIQNLIRECNHRERKESGNHINNLVEF